MKQLFPTSNVYAVNVKAPKIKEVYIFFLMSFSFFLQELLWKYSFVFLLHSIHAMIHLTQDIIKIIIQG